MGLNYHGNLLRYCFKTLVPGETFADEKEEPDDHPEDQGHEGREAVLQAEGEAGEIRANLKSEKISPGPNVAKLFLSVIYRFSY